METGREGRGCHTPTGQLLDQAQAQCLAAEGKEGRTREMSDWGPPQSAFLVLRAPSYHLMDDSAWQSS